jgi:tetratricopeptide (TPR) repeat protein
VVAIYRSAYGRKHQWTGVGVANLASVYMRHEQYFQAEPLFREAIGIFAEALGPDHLNTAIARIKLGRTLLREHRYAEAVREMLAGYQSLSKQTVPGVSWLVDARKDLVVAYDSLGQSDKAATFRALLADTVNNAGQPTKRQ